MILIQSGGYFGGEIGWWFYDNWPLILGVVFVIAVIATIIGASGDKSKPAVVPMPFYPWTSER